jgi:hypothetical protein
VGDQGNSMAPVIPGEEQDQIAIPVDEETAHEISVGTCLQIYLSRPRRSMSLSIFCILRFIMHFVRASFVISHADRSGFSTIQFSILHDIFSMRIFLSFYARTSICIASSNFSLVTGEIDRTMLANLVYNWIRLLYRYMNDNLYSKLAVAGSVKIYAPKSVTINSDLEALINYYRLRDECVMDGEHKISKVHNINYTKKMDRAM